MTEPRIRKIRQLGPVSVYLVRGRSVREELDPRFTNFDQHYHAPYIPEYEFWIDRGASDRETGCYLVHLYIEWSMQRDGESYDAAAAEGRRAEEQVRSDKESRPIVAGPGDAHVELYRILENGLKAWIVEGEFVRDHYDIDFTEGGNDKRYGFIPAGEIWLDDQIDEGERDIVLLHELKERNCMALNMSYDDAHQEAEKLCMEIGG